MNRIVLSLVCVSLLAAGSQARAADAAASHIAIVDMPKAIQSVAEGKKARETLKKEWDERNKKFESEGKKIQDAMASFQKQSMVLDDKARAEQEEALQQRVMKFREEQAKAQQEFQKKDQEVSEPIIKKIKKIVADISKQKGYTLVIDGNENIVIYTGDTDDITDQVIKTYDGKK